MNYECKNQGKILLENNTICYENKYLPVCLHRTRIGLNVYLDFFLMQTSTNNRNVKRIVSNLSSRGACILETNTIYKVFRTGGKFSFQFLLILEFFS